MKTIPVLALSLGILVTLSCSDDSPSNTETNTVTTTNTVTATNTGTATDTTAIPNATGGTIPPTGGNQAATGGAMSATGGSISTGNTPVACTNLINSAKCSSQCIGKNCCAELTDCQKSTDCGNTIKCVGACTTADCITACIAADPIGGPIFDRYFTCVETNKCTTATCH